MKCVSDEILNCIPPSLRNTICSIRDSELQEIRLRKNGKSEIITSSGVTYIDRVITEEDLNFTVNTASQYSPWAAATSAQGYITAAGGHRIGICGEVTVKNGQVAGFRRLSSVCIRIAHDHQGLVNTIDIADGSILIIGAPGWGKTTLLRDLIRKISVTDTICVVDERKELFPDGFQKGAKTDILSGCPKASAIDMLLRTMTPRYIAVDEISEVEDCNTIIRASNCGIQFLATAHALSIQDFRQRICYQDLIKQSVFQTIFVLRPDKSYYTERMILCPSNGLVHC